jgi:hypothetical protein
VRAGGNARARARARDHARGRGRGQGVYLGVVAPMRNSGGMDASAHESTGIHVLLERHLEPVVALGKGLKGRCRCMHAVVARVGLTGQIERPPCVVDDAPRRSCCCCFGICCPQYLSCPIVYVCVLRARGQGEGACTDDRARHPAPYATAPTPQHALTHSRTYICRKG